MPKLVFYRQKRYDDVIHTGVELDGETIAHQYEGGALDQDPALLWYVDVRCEGPGIPEDPDEAASWLLAHAASIRSGLSRFAEHLRVGADSDIYSLNWKEFDDPPPDVELTIACSAVRRVDGRQMASILSEIAENWESILRGLGLPQEAEDLR